MKHQYILGVSAGFHDAATTVIRSDGEIVFAGHSERYSKSKNDSDIHIDLIAELGQWDIDHVAYYEIPWKKQLRQWYSGQGIEWNKLTTRSILRTQLQGFFNKTPTSTHNHHLCHAAAGFQTSSYRRATCVVISARKPMLRPDS
jgi:carbamoyltransferase